MRTGELEIAGFFPIGKGLDLSQNRFGLSVGIQKSQLGLAHIPGVGRGGQIGLLVGAPPHKSHRTVSQAGIEVCFGKSSRNLVIAHHGTHCADFIYEAGLSANVPIEIVNGGGVKQGSDGCYSIIIGVLSPVRIGMGYQDVTIFSLILNAPSALRLHIVDARDDRTGIVRAPYGVGDKRRPEFGSVVVVRIGQTGAFVSNVPRHDHGLVPKPLDKALYEFLLKIQSFCIREQFFSIQCRREKHSSAHPTRQQGRNHLDADCLAQRTKLIEALQHDLVQIIGIFRQFRISHAVFAKAVACPIQGHNWLKIPPVWKDSHVFNSVFIARFQIFLNTRGVKIAPHFSSCIGRPIVCA